MDASLVEAAACRKTTCALVEPAKPHIGDHEDRISAASTVPDYAPSVSRSPAPLHRGCLLVTYARPYRDRTAGLLPSAALIETPRYGLTLFKVHFRRLAPKPHTKRRKRGQQQGRRGQDAEPRSDASGSAASTRTSRGCGPSWPPCVSAIWSPGRSRREPRRPAGVVSTSARSSETVGAAGIRSIMVGVRPGMSSTSATSSSEQTGLATGPVRSSSRS